MSLNGRAIFAVLAGMGAIAVGAWAALQFVYAKRSRSWPSAPGRVTVARVRKESDPEGEGFWAEVEYCYQVQGHDYTGKRLCFVTLTV